MLYKRNKWMNYSWGIWIMISEENTIISICLVLYPINDDRLLWWKLSLNTTNKCIYLNICRYIFTLSHEHYQNNLRGKCISILHNSNLISCKIFFDGIFLLTQNCNKFEIYFNASVNWQWRKMNGYWKQSWNFSLFVFMHEYFVYGYG